MSATEELRKAKLDGVTLSLNGAKELKVKGSKKMVKKWLPWIKENKQFIFERLTPCVNCQQSDVLIIGGESVAGCVKDMGNGPWQQEWHRLPSGLGDCVLH